MVRGGRRYIPGIFLGITIAGFSTLLIGLAEPLMMVEWVSVFFCCLLVLYAVTVYMSLKRRS